MTLDYDDSKQKSSILNENTTKSTSKPSVLVTTTNQKEASESPPLERYSYLLNYKIIMHYL